MQKNFPKPRRYDTLTREYLENVIEDVLSKMPPGPFETMPIFWPDTPANRAAFDKAMRELAKERGLTP